MERQQFAADFLSKIILSDELLSLTLLGLLVVKIFAFGVLKAHKRLYKNQLHPLSLHFGLEA